MATINNKNMIAHVLSFEILSKKATKHLKTLDVEITDLDGNVHIFKYHSTVKKDGNSSNK